MLEMVGLALPMLRRTGLSSGRRQPLVERGLDSTAMLIRLARPSLSNTLLGLMDSRFLKELMFQLELTDRTLLSMILTIVSLPLLLFNKLPQPTTTTTMSRLTPMSSLPRLQTLTGTHSSTRMTQLIPTSVTTPMLPTMLLVTPILSKSRVSPTVPTVLAPTPSSTHMTQPTRADMFSPSQQPLFSKLGQLRTNTTTTLNRTTTTMPTPPSPQKTFSLLESFP